MTIRTRLFLVFILALLVGFGGLGKWMNTEIKAFHNQSYEEVLVDTSNLLAEIIVADIQNNRQNLNALQAAFQRASLRQFSAKIYDVEKQAIDLRVYATDANGLVIFDSAGQASVGEDYSDWRDVRLTLAGKYGARTSDEQQVDAEGREQTISVSYVASPIVSEGVIIGVISVGKPKTNIQKYIEIASHDVIAAIVFALLFALSFALLLYLWLSKPLQLLVEYAEKVIRGERAVPPVSGAYEIRQLAESMAKMRQSLEDKQYVERYVQTLTHEIKSPLTGIMTAAELLSGDLPEPKRQQFCANIVSETTRLSDLANQLLQLAAVEKLEHLAMTESVDLETVLAELIASFQPQIAKKNLTITLSALEPSNVAGDAFLLKQALANLLQNAIEFSHQDGLISVYFETDNNEYRVRIVDQGEGIPDYAMPHIFERFYSLPRPSGKKSTGLGLNFVREVAELHGGAVFLSNNLSRRGVEVILHLKHINSTYRPHTITI